MLFNRYKDLDFTQYINYVAMIYAFLLPLSRAGIGILSGLFIVFWLLEGNFKQKFLMYKNNKVIMALLMFLVWNIFSLFWTEQTYEAARIMKRYWYLLPMFVLMASLKKEYISKVLSSFVFGMFVSEVIAYGVFFEWWTCCKATVDNPSPFMHHIEYSVYLALTALILLNRIFNFYSLKYKIFYTLFFVTVTGNLFLTAGRTGQIAFVIGLFVLTILSFEHKLKAFLASMIIGGLVLTVAFNVSSTFSERIIMGKNNIVNVIKDENYCTSWGSRVGAWIVSKDIIIRHPIIGTGQVDNMKEFHQIIDEKYPSMQCMHEFFMHLHNQYLQVLTGMGLVGLILFLTIFYSLGKMPIREKELDHIKYIYLFILAFAFIPEVLWSRQFSLALSAFIFGVLLAQYRIEDESKDMNV